MSLNLYYPRASASPTPWSEKLPQSYDVLYRTPENITSYKVRIFFLAENLTTYEVYNYSLDLWVHGNKYSHAKLLS